MLSASWAVGLELSRRLCTLGATGRLAMASQRHSYTAIADAEASGTIAGLARCPPSQIMLGPPAGEVIVREFDASGVDDVRVRRQ